jgi:tRNA pseudouridine-54 N-methylase
LKIFITYSKTATTTPHFPRRGVASHTGRLDVIARMLRASLYTPRGLRGDTRFIAILGGPPNAPLALEFDGRKLDCQLRTELESLECIRKCIKGELDGCVSKRKDLTQVLKGIGVPLIVLAEDGRNIDDIQLPKSVGFLVGSQHDVEVPQKIGWYERVSIGPFSYLASHCITFLHYKLDQRFTKDFAPIQRPG